MNFRGWPTWATSNEMKLEYLLQVAEEENHTWGRQFNSNAHTERDLRNAMERISALEERLSEYSKTQEALRLMLSMRISALESKGDRASDAARREFGWMECTNLNHNPSPGLVYYPGMKSHVCPGCKRVISFLVENG